MFSTGSLAECSVMTWRGVMWARGVRSEGSARGRRICIAGSLCYIAGTNTHGKAIILQY